MEVDSCCSGVHWTRAALALCVVVISLTATGVHGLDQLDAEVQRYDGWYNNLAHPDWGSVGSQLYRRVQSAYSDGVYMLDWRHLPGARFVSDLAFSGPTGIRNQRNLTTMLAFFSQVVAYEILHASQTSCPIEMFKVQMKSCDKIFDPECTGKTMMPFFRARYDKETGQAFNRPREQVNEKTSWIDGSFIYSTSEPWVHMMREFSGGLFKEGVMAGYPPENAERLPLINPPPPHVHKLMNPERLFLLGDPRVNENPALLSFALMFFRYHNHQARRFKAAHPDWSDEELFNRARQWVIATLQNIVMYEFLPVYANVPIVPYQGYNPDLPPAVGHLFAAAAFRHAHTLIPPGMFLRDARCVYRRNIGGYPALRLCNTWWNAQDIVQQFSMDDVVLGMASQITEADDAIVTDDLRNFLFGPMHFSRRDLVALSVMRGRDHGLPDYNTGRRAFHLAPRNWSTINPADFAARPGLYHELSRLYSGDIGKLDAYVGGMLEATGDGPGELFTEIILEQFYRLRDADRFWFENVNNELFSVDEIREIYSTKLSDIIIMTTNITSNQIQDNVFFWHDRDPCPQPYQLNETVMEKCIAFMRYDHFRGNEISFIFTCIIMGFIPIICAGIGYFLIRQRRRKDEQFMRTMIQAKQAHSARNSLVFNNNNNNNNNVDGYKVSQVSVDNKSIDSEVWETENDKFWSAPAQEWLHENYSRSVVLRIYQDGTLTISKRRGGLIRSICMIVSDSVMVTVNNESDKIVPPTVLIMVAGEYDLVLRFTASTQCSHMLIHLEKMLYKHSRVVRIGRSDIDMLLAAAETKQKRQQKLEKFFRHAYASAFHVHDMVDDQPSTSTSTSTSTRNGGGAAPPVRKTGLAIDNSVMHMLLTKEEFADALGMKPHDLFIQRMFSAVAKRHPDKISFREFLDMVLIFSNGNIAEKFRIVFDMCDRDGSGKVSCDELVSVMRSIGDIAGSGLTDREHTELIRSMFESAGISRDACKVTYTEFRQILEGMTSAPTKHLGLHLKGRRQTYLSQISERDSVNSFAIRPTKLPTGFRGWIARHRGYLDDYRQHIAYLLVYFTITFAFFMWKFWHYAQMTEHRDIRRVMGLGIAFTRGAAASISFSYGVLLLPVCKNIITRLRATWVNQYVPFDFAIVFHKIVAFTALFFTVVHTVGHCINFYHVSTQSQEGLQCLFQEAVFRSDFEPSIWYWFTGTVTGVSGVLLVVVLSILYVFAAPSVINKAYQAFRLTHLLHTLVFALTVVHGLPKLLDKPSFWLYVLIPVCLYIIDRLLAAKSNHPQLHFLSAQLLTSDVTYVEVKRPRNFYFRSGQWVQISAPAFNCRFNEWHAFSIASSPSDSSLDFYVKACGPWTWKLRKAVYEAQQSNSPFIELRMMGPFGGGNEDWRNYRVAVIVGGGIGVTPYASILRDLVQATRNPRHFTDVACKKVYFLWICSSHKNFEWFIDVLREVEQNDVHAMLEVHIFVTQFFHKFDLRTTMLHLCERHFQRIQGRSMFTNLKAHNHFGRPNFRIFFQYVQERHSGQRDIGLFSCGPSSLNKAIRQDCEVVNRSRNLPQLHHRYETF